MKGRLYVLVLVLVIAVFLTVGRSYATGQEDPLFDGPGVSEIGFTRQPQTLAPAEYVFSDLKWNSFLRSDGSGVLYVENIVENRSFTEMDIHGWCFYWGADRYSNVFARDSEGFITPNVYTHYSDYYRSWGLCVEVGFRDSIQYGEQYSYAIGIMIAGHHTVNNDVINAGWRVRSDSTILNYESKASWPFNHDGVTANPTPDEQGDNYALWRRTNAQAPWELSVSLTVTLGDEMAVEALSQGTAPYDGQDIPWEDDDYGVGTGQTIGDLGCYLTAGTMAINYFARILGFSDSIDPGELNEWLQQPEEGLTVPRGYGTNHECGPRSYCLVNSAAFDEAAEALFDATDTFIVVATDREQIRDIEDMRDNLQNGELGILNVDNGGYGHFVLVKGYTTITDTDTVVINDPFGNRGVTTLLEQYDNHHLGNVRWISRGDLAVRPNYVILYADSPVALLVTDSQGRRAGYDPVSDTTYSEIPGAAYVTEYHATDRIADGDGTKTLQIPAMDFESYEVTVTGTGAGDYQLRFATELGYGEDQVRTITGATGPGEVDQYTIQFDPNEGLITDNVFLPMFVR